VKLFLHVGHGKTGSSFLQSWLAINSRELLSRQGMLYPQICPLRRERDERALAGLFSMGNGYVLDPLLEKDCSRHKQRRWWRRLKQQSRLKPEGLNGLVFSYEPWARQLSDCLLQLIRLADDLDVEGIELWLLVRDPLDHAISVYGQMVKRHGFTGSVEDWLNIYNFPEVLNQFLEAIGKYPDQITLRVDHYGRQRSHLLALLQQWLDLDRNALWQEPKIHTVNRSLTSQELNLMRWLNSRDSFLASFVGERLVNTLPTVNGSLTPPSQEVCEQFLQRWLPEVSAINTLLPLKAHLELKIPSRFAEGSPKDSSQGGIILSAAQLDCLFDGLMEGSST